MYTEDDEKIKVKKNNSQNNYDDFYTSFNEEESDIDKDKNKNRSKRENESELKDESDYSNFYDNVESDDINYEDNNSKKKFIKYGIIVILFIVLIVLVIILLKSGKPDDKEIGDIELNNTSIVLNVGDSDYISYKIINTESKVSSSFTSSDVKVAIVDENGKVTAVGSGETTITVHYTIDNVDRDKQCVVKVNGSKETPTPSPTPTPVINEELTLNLKFIQGSENDWINKDVIIGVETKTELGIESLKYSLNCNGVCNYTDVKDGKITVSSNGITKVTVKAVDKKNKEVTKEVIVKVDKELPSASLNSDKNITSNKDIEVCATCKDSISGCKQSKVCKKYTSSKSNQTITVTDNAGNSKKTSSFNVTINKIKEPCVLKVSSDGKVTATLRESATYYGFNSSYTGNNELSKKIDVSVFPTNKPGVKSGAKVVKYYVKNKNGSGGSCVITIIKECTCNDGTTNDNCSSTCTYRAN